MRYAIWFCAARCMAIPVYAHDLIITEVFYDGTDEYVEISNAGTDTFTGTITLQGLKSSALALDITLASGASLIIGDTLAMLSGTIDTLSSQGLSISDTKAITITLFISGAVIDTFAIATGDVDTYNNTKTAFEYIPSTDTYTAVTSAKNHQTTDGYIANPGVFDTFTTNTTTTSSGSGSASGSGIITTGSGSSTGSGSTTGSGTTSGSGNTSTSGSTLSGSTSTTSAYRLLLTEIFIDGTNEFVEITNVGTGTFTGDITLRGAKASTLTFNDITILAEESYVIIDKTDFLTNTGIVLSLGDGLNMADTQQAIVTLQVEGVTQDSFTVSQDDVQAYDNEKRSFQKVLYSGSYITTYTTPDTLANITGDYIVNPGIVFSVDTLPTQLAFEQLITDCPVDDSTFRITEITDGHSTLPSYIEFQTTTAFDGTLILSGNAVTTPVTFTIPNDTLYPGDYFLLSTQATGFADDVVVFTAANLELAGGQYVLYGQSGQVLDNLYVDIKTIADIYYPNGSRQYCSMSTTKGEQPTPGVSDSILDYLTTTTIVQGGGGGGGTTYVYTPDVSIRALVPKPPTDIQESIELRLDRGPNFLDLDAGYYLMINKTKRYLKGDLYKGQVITLHQNFGFPNAKPACITLYTPNGQVMDEVCYTLADIEGRSRLLTPALDDTLDVTQLEPDVSIIDIVYNPVGKDTGREAITLHNNNALSYDPKDLRLQVGDKSTKTYIHTTLWRDEEKDIVGNFRFPNKATCVSLMHGQILLDTYCYDPAESDGEQDPALHPDQRSPRDKKKLHISISDVIYDPPGTDQSNEAITFTLDEGRLEVEMESFHLLINGKKRKLAGTLTRSNPLTITKSRGFPNTKITCILLMYDTKVYDNYCYDPNDTPQGTAGSGQSLSKGDVQVTSLLYDPPGNDVGQEILTLHNKTNRTIDLTHAYLMINDRKMYLQGSLSGALTGTFIDNYRFPNTKACVGLYLHDTWMDTWCYNSDSAQRITPSTGIIHQLTIDQLDYDPPGNDTHHETITLTLSGTQNLDLTQAHLLINGRKSTLRGILMPGQTTTYQGNYRFPNDGACIQLRAYDSQRDEYCYGASLEAGPATQVRQARITSILPNPYGSDTDREQITINTTAATLSGMVLSVNGTTKKATRTQTAPGTFNAQGSLGLTNRVGCVALSYQGQQLDTLCYQQPPEGVWQRHSQARYHDLDPDALRILNTATVKQIDDQVCFTRSGETIYCKKATNATKKTVIDGVFYRSYASALHEYLRTQRPTLYYESDVSLFTNVYRQAQEQLGDGATKIVIDNKAYTPTNVRAIMDDVRVESYYERLIKHIQSMERLPDS